MRKTSLLIFDYQILTIKKALLQMQSTFSVIYVNTLPLCKAQEELTELRSYGWNIEEMPYSHLSSFVARMKTHLRKQGVKNLCLLPATELFHKRVYRSLRQELSIKVERNFQELAADGCEKFRLFLKKRIDRKNEEALQILNNKFTMLVDEYGDLVQEALTIKSKPMDLPWSRHAEPVLYLGKDPQRLPAQKIQSIQIEEEDRS